jgi:hypothetical protein
LQQVLPHLLNPEWQVKSQVPALQTTLAFATAGQPLPQSPQLAGSVRVSTQRSPGHSTSSAKQEKPHSPPAHVAVALAGGMHGLSQSPQ